MRVSGTRPCSLVFIACIWSACVRSGQEARSQLPNRSRELDLVPWPCGRSNDRLRSRHEGVMLGLVNSPYALATQLLPSLAPHRDLLQHSSSSLHMSPPRPLGQVLSAFQSPRIFLDITPIVTPPHSLKHQIQSIRAFIIRRPCR